MYTYILNKKKHISIERHSLTYVWVFCYNVTVTIKIAWMVQMDYDCWSIYVCLQVDNLNG